MSRFTPLYRSMLLAGSGFIMASGASLSAADVNQVSSNGSSESWATAAAWTNNEPPSPENAYFTNGYTLRTPNSPAGAVVFSGGSLIIGGGTGGATGALNLKAGTTDIANLSIGNGMVLNGNAGGSGNLPATINVTNLTILSAATPARLF